MTPLGGPLLQKVGLGVSWKPVAIQHLPTGESDYQELQGGRRKMPTELKGEPGLALTVLRKGRSQDSDP